MITDCHELLPGSQISYPAGSTNLDCERFRLLGSGGDRLAAALKVFPQLGRLMNTAPPLIICCYPAALGAFPGAVFLDTYLRPANFIRGLALAASRDMTAIVISQPLIVADLLVRALLARVPLPQRMLIAVGGYAMPASLERFIATLLHVGGCEHFEILHAYGVAEVDFGILAALRDEQGALLYRPLTQDVEVRLQGGRIELRRPASAGWVKTDDRAEATADGLLIHGNAARQHPRTMAELERWDYDGWWRCTGRLGADLSRRQRQLRRHVKDAQAGELSFHAFFETCGGDELEKPDWGPGMAGPQLQCQPASAARSAG